MKRYRIEMWLEEKMVDPCWLPVHWESSLEKAQIDLARSTLATGRQYRIIDTQETTQKELRDG